MNVWPYLFMFLTPGLWVSGLVCWLAARTMWKRQTPMWQGLAISVGVGYVTLLVFSIVIALEVVRWADDPQALFLLVVIPTIGLACAVIAALLTWPVAFWIIKRRGSRTA